MSERDMVQQLDEDPPYPGTVGLAPCVGVSRPKRMCVIYGCGRDRLSMGVTYPTCTKP